MSTSVRTGIFVISMTTALGRRKVFEARAASTALAWRFFDAKTSLHPTLTYDAERAIQVNGRALQPGEIGCYSSHYALWEQLLADADAEQYLVLEDDVILDWPFVEKLLETDFAAEGVDYLRLYYKRPVRSIMRKQPFVTRDCSLLELFGRAYGTQGYVITKAGAKAFLDACGTVVRPIDDHMDRSWEHGVANLALFPCPLIEENVPSSIGQVRFDGKGLSKQVQRAKRQDRVAARNAYLRAEVGGWLARKLRTGAKARPSKSL